MAIKDVKDYYFKMQQQFFEMKADLEDFEIALKEGFITEEQMQAAKDELIPLQHNIDRLTFIMYLLEMPNKKEKKPRYARVNNKLAAELKNRHADIESVTNENKSALDNFRAEVKKLIK